MEQTFMTIHNLSPEANILFASESIVDILGFQPREVQGRSCFDYFHPEEVPSARTVHSRGILLDKAAVLHYLRVRTRDGQWISCECCFTVVHDVLVACTSIYRRGEKSSRRALEAPQIRRIFSCSPRDPRYHMLEHLSPKFKMAPVEREPRAALILNRFTRTLSVMFATNSVASILGIRPDQIQEKSFYECIAENCLADAIRCLESAKANDSIAYLRFWYRDPRREEDFAAEDEEQEQEVGGDVLSSASSDSDGGAQLGDAMDIDSSGGTDGNIKNEPSSPDISKLAILQSSSASASSSNARLSTEAATYQAPVAGTSSTPAASAAAATQRLPTPPQPEGSRRGRRGPIASFELEAVVSCTSDGLVVVLRKARPPIPSLHPPQLPVRFENGLFAAPWSEQPINPYYPPELYYHFRPPLLPQYMPVQEHIKAAGGPPLDQLMRSIRDVAVFAWALAGINGKIAAYGHGMPKGESQPPEGLPIWDPEAGNTSYLGPENQALKRQPRPNIVVQARPSSGGPYGPSFSADGAASYGSGNNSTNRPYFYSPSWPNPPPYSPPYESQAAFSQSGQQHHHASAPTYHGIPSQEGWPDSSLGYGQQAHQAPNYQIPTTQSPHPGDSSHGYRQGWP